MNEPGDEYIRRFSNFIRTNEKNLAEAALPRKQKREQQNVFNPFSWFGALPPKALTLSIDTHHLFYILMRIEGIGLDVGTLDVCVENPSRPMSYINLFPDKSDTLSLASFRSSLSAVSALSLGSGWFSRAEPFSLDSQLKYIFSSFTKIPALTITAPGRRMISELANEAPNYNAIPLDSFRNLMSLETFDIDPRTLLGWDKLAESLRSLRIRKSGVEDVSDIFVGAVLDDQARRNGSISRRRRRKIPQGPPRQMSFYGTSSSTSEHEATELPISSHSHEVKLSSMKWAFLKQLSLTDNALTFFPSEMPSLLTSLTHLDLSSNLLVSVPSGLGALYNLISLNLSDNMIDSVLGIYQNLGQVLILNLSRNRLDSICGLERLHALERVDLRGNLIEESAEIGRLAPLPNISEVWVEGNPLVEIEENYRIACLDYFWKEGKSITLDGTTPGYYEKRSLSLPSPHEHAVSRPVSALHSPPIVPVGHSHRHDLDTQPNPAESGGTSTRISTPSPQLGPIAAVGVGGKARRKAKRIVELHETASKAMINEDAIPSEVHRNPPDTLNDDTSKVVDSESTRPEVQMYSADAEQPDSDISRLTQPRSRHTRHRTEVHPTGVTTHDPEEISSSFNSLRLSSKSAARRSRIAASVYESEAVIHDEGQEIGEVEGFKDSAEAFRKKIEALKKEMGDGWLKVFSQTEMRSPTSHT